METKIESGLVDRAGWLPLSPMSRNKWMLEPDKVQWQDAVTKLPCLIVRNHMGAWCGYVGVDKFHPAHGAHYDDDLLRDVKVHGGLTYASLCAETICHVVEPGEDDHVWWLGFDCAHREDYVPGMNVAGLTKELTRLFTYNCTYREMGWVMTQVQKLAQQLLAMKGGVK